MSCFTKILCCLRKPKSNYPVRGSDKSKRTMTDSTMEKTMIHSWTQRLKVFTKLGKLQVSGLKSVKKPLLNKGDGKIRYKIEDSKQIKPNEVVEIRITAFGPLQPYL